MSCAGTGSTAVPNCGCAYCRDVFDEWGRAAEGFQRWYDGLDPAAALAYFGEDRATALNTMQETGEQ